MSKSNKKFKKILKLLKVLLANSGEHKLKEHGIDYKPHRNKY